jgi:hypothetical protein
MRTVPIMIHRHAYNERAGVVANSELGLPLRLCLLVSKRAAYALFLTSSIWDVATALPLPNSHPASLAQPRHISDIKLCRWCDHGAYPLVRSRVNGLSDEITLHIIWCNVKIMTYSACSKRWKTHRSIVFFFMWVICVLLVSDRHRACRELEL